MITGRNEMQKLIHLKVLDINNNMKSLLKEMDNIEQKIFQTRPFINLEGDTIEQVFFDRYINKN